MPTPILPYDEWQAGTLQNSVPANTNALRSEALAANVISDATTAQPASPTDGDCYIIPAAATGAQWATFAEGSLALFRAGTWYEFTAYEGLLKVVAGDVKIYSGSAWAVYGGGGGGGSSSISVEENGVLVASDVTTINFTGSGANVTDAGGGQVDCEIPAGGGGGGGGGGNFTDFARTFNVWWSVDTNSTNTQTHGAANFTGTGTAAAGTISESNIFTSTPRISYEQTTPSTTNRAGLRSGSGWIIGGVSRGGGFRVVGPFGLSLGAANASHRLFFGLNNLNLSPSDVEPSSQTNILGFGYDSADTQIQFMHNDGSGTATKTALGASFPKPSTNADTLYLAEIQRLDGASSVTWKLTNLETGAEASGTASTDLPASNVLMLFNSYASVGGVSAQIGMTFSRVFISTIY